MSARVLVHNALLYLMAQNMMFGKFAWLIFLGHGTKYSRYRLFSSRGSPKTIFIG
jgi:hypothetical protein